MRTSRIPRWTLGRVVLLLLAAAGGGPVPSRAVIAAPEAPGAGGPDEAIVRVLKAAAVCRARGDRAGERRVLDAALRTEGTEPGSATLRLRLAGLLLAMREPAAARRQIDRVLALRPGGRDALLLSGRARAFIGDLEGAIRDYDRVLATGAREGLVADLKLARRMLERKGLDVTLEEAAERNLIPVDWTYALAAHEGRILRLLTRGPDWPRTFTHRSKHFLVRTDAGRAAAAGLAVHLERARTAFDAVLPPPGDGPAPPALVLGFASQTDYVRYLAGLAGSISYVPGTAGVFFPGARLLAIRLRGRMESALPTIYHEAFHLEVDRRIGALPRWLNEGLADALSTRIVATTTGRPADPPRWLTRLRALRARNRLPSIHAVLALPDAAFMDARRAPDAYSKAWILADFLLDRDAGRKTGVVRDLLLRIRNGQAPDEAASGLLRGPDAPRLESEFRIHVWKRLENSDR